MSDTIIVAVIAGLFSILSLVITLVVKNKVTEVGKAVDGRMDELLKLTRESSGYKAKLEEKAEVASLVITTPPAVPLGPSTEIDVNIKSLPPEVKLP